MSIKEKIKGRVSDAFNYAVVHRPVLTGTPEIAAGGGIGIAAVALGAAPIIAGPALVAAGALLIHGAARNGIDRVKRIDEMMEYDQARAAEKAAKKGFTPK